VQDLLPRELFKGKTVFVTGGGSGINLGVARNFAALGANIAICGARRRSSTTPRWSCARSTARERQGAPVAADVRDYAALESAFKRTRDEVGAIDVLVCGAAGNFLCPAEDLSPNGFKTVIDIDLQGSFHASRAAFEQLKADARHDHLSSRRPVVRAAGLPGARGAAKAGIDIMMKDLAIEWGKHGVRTNSIVPGPIEGTEGMNACSRPGDGHEEQGRSSARPLRHRDDIGQAAVFLASRSPATSPGRGSLRGWGQRAGGSAIWNQAVKRWTSRGNDRARDPGASTPEEPRGTGSRPRARRWR
jgi:NAD(P)-dependent dehydrogenase (short-subunit alcohol dehydrogenase family)